MFRRGRRSDGKARWRLLFATDLHGSENCFRKFLAAGPIYGVNALVLGGDLTGKALRPVVQDGDGYRVGIAADGRRLAEADLPEYERQAAAGGAYSVVLSEQEAAAMDDERIDALLREHATARARSWAVLAAERLAGTGLTCYVSGGNDDTDEVLRAFDGVDDKVVFCDQRAVTIGEDLAIASIGFSNPTPWRTSREVGEPELREMIDSVAADLPDPRRSLLAIHVPPIASGLDRCPQLDTSTDPPTVVRVGGEVVLGDAGSTAVREALEALQPRVSLHGHIHESRGATRIGDTLAVNPGSEYRDGVLRAVLVTLDGNSVRHQFISG